MDEIIGFPTQSQLHDLKRREILRCAARKFGEEGYDNVPLEAIAAELGVTKAALYTYVKSKNDLLIQCYEIGMVRLVSAMEAAMDVSGSAADRLSAGLCTYIETMTRRDMQYLWSHTRPMVTSGDVRRVQSSRDRIDHMVRDLLCEGMKDGSLRDDLDPKLSSLVILGAVNWIGIWYRPDGPQKPADLAREVVTEALHGYLSHDRTVSAQES